jgi:hypothetical protein
MKIALWSVVGLLATIWTGGAMLATALTRWSADLIASGGAAELGRTAAQWPAPAWLAPWIDAAWMKSVQQMLLWSTESIGHVLPWLGSAVGWLLPFVWALWGLGVVGLLVLAGVAHLLIGRTRPLQARPA